MELTLPERIRAYLANCPVAESGNHGHRVAFTVACALVHGWDLTIHEALPYFEEYNSRCLPPWSHHDLLHKLECAEKASPKAQKPRGHLLGGKPKGDATARPSAPAAAPKREQKREEWAEVNMSAVNSFIAGLPPVDTEWFMRRSPVDVTGVTSGDFLDALFEPGERIVIFTRYYSQGDFLWWVKWGPKGAQERGTGFRLSEELETKAVPSLLPKSNRVGAWWLVQPVTGKWEIGTTAKDGTVKYTRRSEQNVTRWLHYVLESDIEGSDEWWPRVVAGLRLPIVAVYTSGGRSIHAIVRYPVPDKTAFDKVKDAILKTVCPLGADPGVNSAVRLSRLPGVFREGKEEEAGEVDERGRKKKRYVRYRSPQLQRLLYLNPAADYTAIVALPEVRG